MSVCLSVTVPFGLAPPRAGRRKHSYRSRSTLGWIRNGNVVPQLRRGRIISGYRTSYIATGRQSSAIRADVSQHSGVAADRVTIGSTHGRTLEGFHQGGHIDHHIVSLACGMNTSVCTGEPGRRLPSSAMIEKAARWVAGEPRSLSAIQ